MKLKRKNFVLMLLVPLIMLFSQKVYANDGITVIVNDSEVQFTDRHPIIVDGRTLVPIRDVFEAIGFNVNWHSDTSTVTLDDGFFVVTIQIGASFFSVISNNDSVIYQLDVPAQIVNGRTMLPLRAVLESVGYYLDWDNITKTIIITSMCYCAEIEEYIRLNYEHIDESMTRTLLEVFMYFDENLSSEDIDFIKSFEFDDLIQFHFGWGMGIRNAWLWSRNSGIYFEFFAMGIVHPDNMSQLIIRTYYLYLNDLDYEAFLDSYISQYACLRHL
jgi:hypothetical protein